MVEAWHSLWTVLAEIRFWRWLSLMLYRINIARVSDSYAHQLSFILLRKLYFPSAVVFRRWHFTTFSVRCHNSWHIVPYMPPNNWLFPSRSNQCTEFQQSFIFRSLNGQSLLNFSECMVSAWNSYDRWATHTLPFLIELSEKWEACPVSLKWTIIFSWMFVLFCHPYVYYDRKKKTGCYLSV